MTPAITSPMGGQPGTLMIGLPEMISSIGVALVGLGLDDWMQPFEAQLPHATIALAPEAASLTISRAVRPPMQQ